MDYLLARRFAVRVFKVQPAFLFAVIAVAATADRAAAHQKWLWPNVFFVEKGPAWVSVDVTWGDQPFTAGEGVGEQAIVVVGPDGARSAATGFVGKTKSTAEVELTAPGTYRFESVDAPAYWTQIDADGKEQWIKKPKSQVTGSKITRADLYYSEAVAYVTVGSPSELPAAGKDDPLEITLKTHPARITAGEPAELAVVSYGKPVGKARVNVFGPTTAGHDPEQSVDCDERGVATVRLAKGGRHLLTCDLERAVTDDPRADMHSFHAYVTIFVNEAKK
jgi:uncharacterized GH25 family protein